MIRRQNEWAIVSIVAAVQFVNILDFMIVMPLGPFFAGSLQISTARLGIVGGSYTAAAAASGLAGSFFLDRFDRRSALVVSMLGLVLGTLACGFATSFTTLIAARLVAGIFGGPATSVALSIVADVIAPERRGKAMGIVMASFAIASVIGVPAGLGLAELRNWRWPFIATAILGAFVLIGAWFQLPSLRGHLEQRRAAASMSELFKRPLVLASYLMSGVQMLSAFLVIPSISPYLVYNLHYPGSALWLLYLVGGLASLVGMQAAGALVDRFGSLRVCALASLLLVVVLYLGFVSPQASVPILAVFVAFMLSMSIRNLTVNTLTTKVPEAHERARFMSLQSVVQHLGSATGAGVGARLLSELPDRSLQGMPTLGAASLALAIALVPIVAFVERGIARKALRAAKSA